MGWNTTVAVAAGKSAADLLAALPDVFARTDRTIDWAAASATALGKHVAVGEIPGWAAVWTPNINVTADPDVMSAASAGGRAVAVYLSSVSSIHGFALWVDGDCARLYMRDGAEVAADDGDPLPEEAGLYWSDAEAAVFAVARKLTGLDLPNANTWGATTFTVAEI